jgi:hypothetical protein
LVEKAEDIGNEDVDTNEFMVVMDKAPFHTVKLVEEKRPVWDVRGPGFYCLLRTAPT